MRKIIHNILFILAFLSAASVNGLSQTYYVSTSGSDSNPGTLTSPFLTIAKAVSVVKAGETIFVRGGTYDLTSTISLSKSGTENAPLSLLGYTCERPMLDFSDQALSGSNRGIVLTGNYWHIRGLDITGAGDNGMVISGGSNNLIELCNFYRNRDSGLQLDNGASDNTIRNCDSYYNADPEDYGDADGFAPKLTVGSGNYFYGCRAWLNCDDGWDGYLRNNDDVTNFIENCWAFRNGYFENGTDAGENANGNGFKMGGSDDKSLKHNFTLKNCLAFGNKSKGFDQNNNKGSMTLYNCTGHGNEGNNYSVSQALADGKELTIKNSVEYGGKISIGSFAIQEKNSWLSPFVVTADDFQSLDYTAAAGPRRSDGGLPDIEYMHLTAGSDMVDAGVDVGLTYAGSAPDLGCFETGLSAISDIGSPGKVVCYPNPVTDIGYIKFTAERTGRCEVRLYDITGRYVRTITDKNIDPGENIIRFNLSDIREGLYMYRLSLNNTQLFVGRIIRLSSSH
jgi:hypothetical protein